MSKIYVASSWRNPIQATVVERLRGVGHEVYDFKNPPGRTGFSWREIDPNWQKWTPEEYLKALESPKAEAGFKSDADAMAWADTCVLVLPCGRSAHLEAGRMSGERKRLIILLDDLSIPTPGHTFYSEKSPLEFCTPCSTSAASCVEFHKRSGQREPELMYKFADFITSSLDQVVARLQEEKTIGPVGPEMHGGGPGRWPRSGGQK